MSSAELHDSISRTIGLIYEASTNISLWPRLLESISDYVQSVAETSPQSEEPLSHLSGSLSQHFERAYEVRNQLTLMLEERDLLENFMNRLPLGAAILDSKSNVVCLNRTLSASICSNHLLSLVKGRLVSNPEHVLERAVWNVTNGGVTDEIVRLEYGDEQLSLWVARGGVTVGRNRVMLLVANRTAHALSEQGLSAFFGLTKAEARVTQQMALGFTLEETAEALHISKNTAKTHLARIFSKLGVNRQVELIQLIYSNPLWLQSDPKKLIDRRSAPRSEHWCSEDRESFVNLPDGRKLYYSDCGDSDGFPLVLMHGLAGSRLMYHPDERLLHQYGVRLIVPERPGCGDSTRQNNRCHEDGARDLSILLDQLGVERFSMLGYSVGAPYALHAASLMPQRVISCHLVSVFPPFMSAAGPAQGSTLRMLLFMAKNAPGLLPILLRGIVEEIHKNTFHYLEKVYASAPEKDCDVLGDPRFRSVLTRAIKLGVQQGEQEISNELILAASDWSRECSGVVCPIRVWHGEGDSLIPVEEAERMAALLPQAEFTRIADGGHLLLFSHWETMLRAVAGQMNNPTKDMKNHPNG